MPQAAEAQNLNHLTARKVPLLLFLVFPPVSSASPTITLPPFFRHVLCLWFLVHGPESILGQTFLFLPET